LIFKSSILVLILFKWLTPNLYNLNNVSNYIAFWPLRTHMLISHMKNNPYFRNY